MIQPTRLFDFAYYQKERYNLTTAFADKRNGSWISVSSEEFLDQGNAISRGLLRLGINSNDKIALISTTNRSEWNICDFGALQIGAQDVPIYPTSSKEDYQYILHHSESVICFVSCADVYAKIAQIKDQVPSLKHVYSFDQLSDCAHWSEVLELGADQSNQQEVDARKNEVQEDDLATIIYTSGTTGKPKGVMVSNKKLHRHLFLMLPNQNILIVFGIGYLIVSYS